MIFAWKNFNPKNILNELNQPNKLVFYVKIETYLFHGWISARLSILFNVTLKKKRNKKYDFKLINSWNIIEMKR
jgi:hypothetical protein